MRDAYSDDPSEPGYWPVRLPQRERVTVAMKLLAAGAGWRSITDRTGITTNRLTSISREPWRWDTVDDEVAIERALEGDRSVLPALTLYERARVREALAERLEREPYEPAFDPNRRNRHISSDHWLTLLAEGWGVDRIKLFGRLHRFTTRKRAA